MTRRSPTLLSWLLAGVVVSGGLTFTAAQTGSVARNAATDPNFTSKLPTTSERLQQLQQRLSAQQQLSAQQKTELEGLRARVAQLGDQQKSSLRRIDVLNENIARLETARRALDAQIQGVQAAIQDLNMQIEVTQAKVDRLKQDVRQLLVSLYRERSGRYLQLLSQASSLSDLLIRAKYANMSGQNNVQMAQTLKVETRRLQTQRSAQAGQQKQLETLQARQVAQLQQLQAQRQEATTLVEQLKQSQAGQQALAVQTQAQQALTASSIQNVISGILRERSDIEARRQQLIRQEQARRAAELARIRAEQEAARQEQLRLARLKAEQEAARQEQLRLARLKAEQERQAQAAHAEREQAALQARQAQAAQAAREQQVLQAQQQARQAREAQAAREQAALQARRNAVQTQQVQAQQDLTPLPASTGPLGFPLPGGQVSEPFNGDGAGWTIFSGSEGAQAVAVADGQVLASANYANTGWVVLIDHGSLAASYIFLSQSLVQPGERVTRGQPIGVIGGSPQYGPGSMGLVLVDINSQQRLRPPY